MTPKPISNNTLFYGDNLTIMREHIRFCNKKSNLMEASQAKLEQGYPRY
jgi:hypothetical protein